ncbi:hypothetical protein [Streptomyces sp. NPDC048338]|uniref:hypothetical protein n=1 Tax=Streptomyces sp. NPDC048338 TaxID=3365536 RepID=UPI0037117209
MISPQDIDVKTFLETWHGRPDLEPTPPPAEALWLPPALQHWAQLESRWSKDLSTTLYVELPWREQAEEGRAVFMRDQGGWELAFSEDAASHLWESSSEGVWTPISKSVSEALLHAAFLEVVWSAPTRLDTRRFTAETVGLVTSAVEEVEFSAWNAPGSGRAFMGDGILVLVKDLALSPFPSRRQPGYFAVQAVAVDRSKLSHVEAVFRAAEEPRPR